ncbi:hypothetical protein D9M68_665690 [compost metagenome]
MVAFKRCYATSADFINYLVGVNVVTYQITKAINGIRLLTIHIQQHSFKCGLVGMYIRKKCYSHN